MRASIFFLFLMLSPAHADGFGFMTPSGNIYCNGQVSGGGQLSCTIIERSGQPAAPRPTNCQGTWGHEFKLDGNGPLELICGNPPERVNYSDIANYGVAAEFGNISCNSLKTGFTCSNADGNGFFLSRRTQSVLGLSVHPNNDVSSQSRAQNQLASNGMLGAPTGPSPASMPSSAGETGSTNPQNSDAVKYWLLAKIYLKKLGFDPGNFNGAADARTLSAIHAFQRTYKMKVQNHLPANQFAVLEALATAQSGQQNHAVSAVLQNPALSQQTTESAAQPAKPIAPVTNIAQNARPTLTSYAAGPERQFTFIDGHTAIFEGSSPPEVHRAWDAWMLANLPLAQPELINLDDTHTIVAAHVLLSDAEQAALNAQLNLTFNLFLRGEELKRIKRHNRAELTRLLHGHASSVLHRQLDEFTRQGAMTAVRNALQAKFAREGSQFPISVVQVYEVTLGEYDFETKKFEVESIRGSGNSAKNSPEASRILKLVGDTYKLPAKINSDTKEFPIFIPMEPDQAKALVDRLAAHRGDKHRVINLGVFGAFEGLTMEANPRDPNRPTLTLNHTVSRLDFSIDKELAEIIHRQIPDKLLSDEVNAVAAAGAQSPGRLFGPEYLVAALSDKFPDFLDAQGMMDMFMRDRIVLENSDLSKHGLRRAQVQPILRQEILQGTREPNADDYRLYRSYLDGLQSAGLSDEIILPMSVFVNADQNGRKFIEKFRPIDLLSRALRQSARRFGRLGESRFNAAALSEPGRLILSAAGIRGVERRSHVPVLFSVKLNKSSANPELQLPETLKEPSTRRSGPGDAFETQAPEGQLFGHVALRLESAPQTISGLKGVPGGKAVLVKVTLKEIIFVDQGTEMRFPYGKPPAEQNQNAKLAGVDVPDTLFLDAETSDLLIVRYLGDTVTDQDFERMLLGRWELERRHRDVNSAPVWGRFFEIGTPKPEAGTLKAFLPKFKDWTRLRAENLPETVRVKKRISAQNGSARLGFGTTFANPNAVSSAVRNCTTELNHLQRQANTQKHTLQMVENACNYLRRASDLPSDVAYIGRSETLKADYRKNLLANSGAGYLERHGSVGVRIECGRFGGEQKYCRGIREELKKGIWDKHVFVLDDVYVFDKLISLTPEAVAKSRGKNVELQLLVKVKGVERSNRARLSPTEKAIQKANKFLISQKIRQKQNGSYDQGLEIVDTNFFDLEVQVAELVNRKTGQRVATVPLSNMPSMPDSSLLEPIGRIAVEAPSGPYGFDIIGVKLGMTFEEADRIIREQMDVGRVIKANGGWQNYEISGQITPYSSGVAYESKDKKDLIILHDQPPSVTGVVLGAVRQVALEKGKIGVTQVLNAAREKYGPEDHREGHVISWGRTEGVHRKCAAFAGAVQRRDAWKDLESGEMNWTAENSTFRGSGGHGTHPPTPSDIERRTLEYKRHCPPGVTVNFDTRENPNWDRIVFRLHDYKQYLDHLNESEHLVAQNGPPRPEGQEPEAKLEIKF
ncbi:MAG: hypothetical protein JJ979_17255 [Roseibium sp.]|nr:hypothetical protein [Roseibium sp.]